METALHYAVKRGFMPLVKLLILYNCDIDAKDCVIINIIIVFQKNIKLSDKYHNPRSYI